MRYELVTREKWPVKMARMTCKEKSHVWRKKSQQPKPEEILAILVSSYIRKLKTLKFSQRLSVREMPSRGGALTCIRLWNETMHPL